MATKPTKLTPNVQEKICSAIADGNTRTIAAALSGIAESTFYKWMAQGREARSGRFKEFYEAVKQAEAFAIADRISRIRKAGKDGDWKADAWWLERTQPETYGRKVITADLTHSGEVSHSHDIDTTNEIEQRLQEDEEGRELLKKLWEWEQKAKSKG